MTQQDMTNQWEAAGKAVRARLAAPGVARPEQVRIEPGKAIFQGRPRKRHYNPMGTVHGG